MLSQVHRTRPCRMSGRRPVAAAQRPERPEIHARNGGVTARPCYIGVGKPQVCKRPTERTHHLPSNFSRVTLSRSSVSRNWEQTTVEPQPPERRCFWSQRRLCVTLAPPSLRSGTKDVSSYPRMTSVAAARISIPGHGEMLYL